MKRHTISSTLLAQPKSCGRGSNLNCIHVPLPVLQHQDVLLKPGSSQTTKHTPSAKTVRFVVQKKRSQNPELLKVQKAPILRNETINQTGSPLGSNARREGLPGSGPPVPWSWKETIQQELNNASNKSNQNGAWSHFIYYNILQLSRIYSHIACIPSTYPLHHVSVSPVPSRSARRRRTMRSWTVFSHPSPKEFLLVIALEGFNNTVYALPNSAWLLTPPSMAPCHRPCLPFLQGLGMLSGGRQHGRGILQGQPISTPEHPWTKQLYLWDSSWDITNVY